MHTLSARSGADMCAQSVLIDKISASERSRRLIKSALLVGGGRKERNQAIGRSQEDYKKRGKNSTTSNSLWL